MLDFQLLTESKIAKESPKKKPGFWAMFLLFAGASFLFPFSAVVYPETIPFESNAEDKEGNLPNSNSSKTNSDVSQFGGNPPLVPPNSVKLIDWDIDRLTEYAVSNNPLYLSERQNMGIERGRVITASLYRNPMLQFQQQFIGGNSGSQGGSPETAPALYQDVDVFGVVPLRTRVAKKSFEASLQDFRNFDRVFRMRLRQNYWAFVFLTLLVDTNKEFYENYSDLLELTKFRVQKGDISPLEFERLELERIQVEKYYRDAIVRRQTIEKDLRILTGLSEEEGVFAFKVDSMKFKPLDDLGLYLKEEFSSVDRPDVVALEQRLQEKKMNIELQRKEAFGWLQLGGEWRMKGGENYGGVFATIPIPLNDRGQGKVYSAKEEYRKFELALDAKKREVSAEIEAAKKELLAREELLTKYERINLLQKNKQLEEKSRIAYVRGASDQVTFLQAEKNYLTILREYYDLLYLYFNAVEAYKAATGKIADAPNKNPAPGEGQ